MRFSPSRWILPAATAGAVLLVTAAAWSGPPDEPHGCRAELRIDARKGEDDQARVRLFVDGREVEAQGVPDPLRAEPRGYLGVAIEPADDGVRITQVFPDSPAAKAGLRVGDRITAVDDRDVRTPDELVETIASRRPGRPVTLAYRRGDASRTASVVLGERPMPPVPLIEPPEAREPERDKPPDPFLGVVAAPLSDEMKEIAGTDEGVLINELVDDSPASDAGLLPGDVIIEVDGKPVTEPERFVEMVRQRKPGDRVFLTYYRMGRRRRVTVTLGERPTEGQQGLRLWELPEGLRRTMPELREYLEKLRPELENWAERFQEWQERQSERFRSEGPVEPQEAVPGPGSYGVGKDIGRILEKLDRIERRLDELEERTERRLREMEKRLERERGR